MSDHDAMPLYTVKRLGMGDGRSADFLFVERKSTLHEAHGAAARWRATVNEEGLSFYCRVQIVVPSRKGETGFYRIWVGPQERGQVLLHLPGEKVDQRNDIMRAHLNDANLKKHKRRRLKAS